MFTLTRIAVHQNQNTQLVQGKSRPDGTEVLNIRRVTIDEAVRMSVSGEITDALSLLAIMRFQLKGIAKNENP